MYIFLVCVSSNNSYLSAVDQEHAGHGQLHQHQNKQQDKKLQSENHFSHQLLCTALIPKKLDTLSNNVSPTMFFLKASQSHVTISLIQSCASQNANAN